MRHTVFNELLMCNMQSWWVMADDYLVLELANEHHCDMGGAIGLGELLMPNVTHIFVFSGDTPDILYRIYEGNWIAVPAPLLDAAVARNRAERNRAAH